MPTLDETIHALQKRYGSNVIMKASEKPTYPRIKTGVLGLDVRIGGGVPLGAMTILSGFESTGKTTVACKTIANAQKTCRQCFQPIQQFVDDETGELTYACDCKAPTPMRVVYIDVEGTLDLSWTAALGVDVDAVRLVVPDYAEQALDILDALVRTGEVDLIILDSLAALAPTTEIEKSTEDWQVGLQARLLGKMCRKLTASWNSLGIDNPRKPAVIAINQLREKMVLHGDPITMPGGNAIRFFASIILRFRNAGWVTSNGKKEGTRVGAEIAFRQMKNKTAAQHEEGVFKLYNVSHGDIVKGDVNTAEMIIEQGVLLGVIHKGGSWLSYGIEGTESFVKAQGEVKFTQQVMENPDLFQELQDVILAMAVSDN